VIAGFMCAPERFPHDDCINKVMVMPMAWLIPLSQASVDVVCAAT
jgi:hypothetical protein